ncbi:trypsin-like peptidase domain-containing protein [Streptomyces sp. NPDC049590]|uniref:VMAP-C domain-containing protein n=1 Tax=Streptomyces sp. NPDC049590 TaxID=3154834 RepID=UPI0034495549
MRGSAWQARITCGGEVGAGFLVTGRLVLTCAHVVHGGAPVKVCFPHARELGELSARVVAEGGWAGGVTDPGDVAVLELAVDQDLPLAPARFAPPDAAYTEPYPKLVSYGFPEHYDEGTLAEYQAVSAQLIAGEWLELVTWHGHGQPIVEGFSGAAATLPDGTVAGMVTAALGTSPQVRKGRMLPLDVLARYWPGLDELVPVPGLGEEGRRRLYDLLDRAAAGGGCDPDRLYLDAVGPFGPPLPPGGFPSLRAAARYVRWEVPDPDALLRFTDRLGELVGGSPVLRGQAAPDAATAQAGPAWSPVVVEIDHSGAGPDQVTVEVSAYRDGRRRPVGAHRLPRAGVRAYVQSRIDEAVAHLAPDADELVTFVLPREWLNEAVAHWECGADDSTPLGCAYPLVVTDRARHHSGRLRRQLRKKWQKLDTGGGVQVHRVECGTRERPPSLRKRLWDGDAPLAGFAAPPTVARPHFEVGLNVPVPVLLWSRTGGPCAVHGDTSGASTAAEDASRPGAACPDPPRTGNGHADPPGSGTGRADAPPAGSGRADAPPAGNGRADASCPGTAFLDRLTASVADVPPAELPRHLMELRLTAEAADDPEGHWARHVQLLWDDPRCFPETGASLHSPVA